MCDCARVNGENINFLVHLGGIANKWDGSHRVTRKSLLGVSRWHATGRFHQCRMHSFSEKNTAQLPPILPTPVGRGPQIFPRALPGSKRFDGRSRTVDLGCWEPHKKNKRILDAASSNGRRCGVVDVPPATGRRLHRENGTVSQPTGSSAL